MREVIKFYRLINLLNLDVAAGAVISSLFFAKIYGVTPSILSIISLGFTVWIIYTVDRLLDVREVDGEAASERHRFHHRNQKKLFYGLAVVTTVDIVLVFFLPSDILLNGGLLSGIVVVYIILRKRLHMSKELLVAVLYTAGVILPVWPVSLQYSKMYLPILLFFLIALINLLIFSWYEKENDLKDKQNSIATLTGERTIRKMLIVYFISALSISSYLFFLPAYHLASLVFIVMIALLFLIFRYKRFFARDDYYRWIGDAVFLLPVIYLFA